MLSRIYSNDHIIGINPLQIGMADSKGVSEAVEIAQQELEYRVELFNKF